LKFAISTQRFQRNPPFNFKLQITKLQISQNCVSHLSRAGGALGQRVRSAGKTHHVVGAHFTFCATAAMASRTRRALSV